MLPLLCTVTLLALFGCAQREAVEDSGADTQPDTSSVPEVQVVAQNEDVDAAKPQAVVRAVPKPKPVADMKTLDEHVRPFFKQYCTD